MKFRAWNMEIGLMIEGCILESMVGDSLGTKYKLSWMRSTEVFDINKKEIYEHDIVKVLRNDSFKSYISTVYFANGCFGTAWYDPTGQNINLTNYILACRSFR